MRAWIGKYVAGVGTVHTVSGLVGLRDTFADLIRDGLVNTVNGQPEREFAFWFVAIGLFWVVLGALIDHDERRGQPLPGFLGWALGALTLVAVAIMPLSGWWLFFIPVFALVRRSRNRAGTA